MWKYTVHANVWCKAIHLAESKMMHYQSLDVKVHEKCKRQKVQITIMQKKKELNRIGKER